MTDNEKFLARSWYILLVILSSMIIAIGYGLWTQTIPDGNQEQAYFLIGLVSAKFGDVVAWRVNSSKGSSDKTGLLRNGQPPQEPPPP